MLDPVAAATDFVQACYPGAPIAFLGGSTSVGQHTSTSDLDVFVVVDDAAEVAYVETTRHRGWLVEAFVYSRTGAEPWLRRGRERRRPVLDSIIGRGVPLTDNDETRDWAQRSRDVLAAGPADADSAELERRRYALSGLVDDLDGSRDRQEDFLITSSVFIEAAELALVVQRQWLGTGKWLIRNLRATDDHGLLAWVDGERDPTALAGIARSVLDAAGGYLQEGALRGERPLRRSP